MGNSAQTNSNQNQATNSATNSLSGTQYGSNTASNTAQNTAQQTANQSQYSSATGPSAAGQALINQATNPANTIANLQSYLSPYTSQVLGAQTALQNQQDAIQQQQLAGNAASAGALGGDRAILAGAQLAGQQALANNMANSQTLQAGYNQALQAAQQTGAQQLQGAGLSGTQTAGGQQSLGSTTGSSTGATQSATQGGANTAQSSATAGTGATSGSSTTTQQPGALSYGAAALGLLGGGNGKGSGRARGGAIHRDAGGSVDGGQWVYVPAQNGAGGQWVQMPATAVQQAQGGMGGGQGGDLNQMYHLGQQARQGLSNILGSLTGSSSTPTTGAGGWQTGTQTSGLVGSGGVTNTLSNLGSSIGQGVSNVGSAIGQGLSNVGFAKGGSADIGHLPSSAFFSAPTFQPMAAMPTTVASAAPSTVSAPSVSMPALSIPNIGQATMPTVLQASVPRASSGKGSGGAVRGFANGGGPEDDDYGIYDAFEDADDVLLKGGMSSAHPGEPPLDEQERAALLRNYQGTLGNVYPPTVNLGTGPMSLGSPAARRFEEVQPAPEREVPPSIQDINAQVERNNQAFSEQIAQAQAAKDARAAAAPPAQPGYYDEDADAQREISAHEFANPMPAKALQGAPSEPLQAQPPADVAAANRALLENNRGLGLGDKLQGLWAHSPQTVSGMPAGGLASEPFPFPDENRAASAASPPWETRPESAPTLASLPQSDIPLPTRKPATLGQAPVESVPAEPAAKTEPQPFSPERTQAAIDRHSEQAKDATWGRIPHTDQLATDRSRYVEELRRDPALRQKLLTISLQEQNDPTGNLAIIETAMNRASVNHTSLAQELRMHNTEGGYYGGPYRPELLNNPKVRQMAEANLARALQGSNVAKYGTDNSSGAFGSTRNSNGMYTPTAAYNGEYISYPSRPDARGYGGFPDWLNKVGGTVEGGLHDFAGAVQGAGAEIGHGVNTIGQGIAQGVQSAGQGAYSTISSIGSHIASALGGANTSPAQQNQDRGLFANLFGVDPLHLSPETRHTLMNMSQILAGLGANQLPQSLSAMQANEMHQKQLAQQLAHQNRQLQLEEEKVGNQKQHYDDWRSVMGDRYGPNALTPHMREANNLVKAGIAPDIYTAYGLVRKGVSTQNSKSYEDLVIREQNAIKDEPQYMRLSPDEKRKVAEQRVLDTARSEGYQKWQEAQGHPSAPATQPAAPAASPAQQAVPSRAKPQANPFQAQQGNTFRQFNDRRQADAYYRQNPRAALSRATEAIRNGKSPEHVVEMLKGYGIPDGLIKQAIIDGRTARQAELPAAVQ